MGQRMCEGCGKVDLSDRPKQTKRCDPFQQQRKRENKRTSAQRIRGTVRKTTGKVKLCQWEGCGEPVSARSPLATFCLPHQAENRKQKDAERYQAKKLQATPDLAKSKLGGSKPGTMRYVRCGTCKEEYAIPYRMVDPGLCAFCQDALKRKVAQASSEEAATVKRLGKVKGGSSLNVEERARGYYMVRSARYPEGRWMVARMVV